MKTYKITALALLAVFLSGCMGVETIVSPERLSATSDIVVTDSGRVFVSAIDGLYEVIDDNGAGDATLRLVTKGLVNKNEACAFFGLQAHNNTLYAACAYLAKPRDGNPILSNGTSPLNGILAAPSLESTQSVLFQVTLDDTNPSQYQLVAGILPSPELPRNLALLADGRLLYSNIANKGAVTIYATSFAEDAASARDGDVLQVAIEPWHRGGDAHGMIALGDAFYLSSDTGFSLTRYDVTNSVLQASTATKVHTAPWMFVRVIPNVNRFDNKLVLVEESFSVPFVPSKYFIMNTDGALPTVEKEVAIPKELVASNVGLKRQPSGKITAYIVSYYHGGIYRMAH